jgi:Fe-S cluster biogenesis protein NfuA
MSMKSIFPNLRQQQGPDATDENVAPSDIARILRMIRPSFRSRGGDIQLVGIKDRSVVIRLSGACDDCPISFAESSGVIARVVRSRIPQIESLTVI